MPRIPTLTNDQTVQPGPAGGLTTPDFGPGIGTGMQALGQGLDEAAKTAQYVQAQTAEAGAKARLSDYSKFRDSLLYTNDDAFYRQEGQNAVDASKNIASQLQQKYSDLTSGLSPLQTRMVQATVGNELEKDITGVGTYTGKQLAVANDQQSSGLQYQMHNSATTAYLAGDDQGFATAMGTMVNSIRQQNQSHGLSGPHAMMAEDKAVSGVWQNIIQQKAVTDPLAAKQLLDQRRGEIKDQDVIYSLDKQLEPFVQDVVTDKRVDSLFGTGDGAPASAPTSDDASLVSKIGRVENNTGNPAAKNPLSSAQGPQQFIDQTWLGVMHDHGPSDLASAIQKQGHRYVIADQSKADLIWAARNDPKFADQMSAANARDNRAQLGRAGVNVDDGSLYAAHVLGPTGAIRLLKSDPNTPMTEIVSAAALKANPMLRGNAGDAVGRLYQAMGGAGPSTPNQTYSPRRDDLNTLLARVDAMNLPPQERDAVRQKVVARVSMDQRLLDADQTDAANQAWAVAMNPQSTSIQAIPPNLWSRVAPAQQREIMGALKHNADGTSAPPNPDLYLDLSDKAGKGTLSMADVRQSWGKLPPEDFNHFAGLAKDIEAKTAKGNTAHVTMQAVNAVVSNALDAKLPMTDPTLPKRQQPAFKQAQAQRRYDFQKALMNDIGVWQAQPENKDKAPDAKTIQAIADRRLLQTNVGATSAGGWLASATPSPARYQFESAGPGRLQIPTAQLERIQARAVQRIGRRLTPDEALHVFMVEPRGGE